MVYNKWQSFFENGCHFVIKNNWNSNGIKLAFADFRFIGEQKVYICAAFKMNFLQLVFSTLRGFETRVRFSF